MCTVPKELTRDEIARKEQYDLYINAPFPLVTCFKSFDVTNLVKISKKKHLKFNMLMNYCVGKAALPIKEFFYLPIDENLMIEFESVAVCTLLQGKPGSHSGPVKNCEILATDDLEQFNQDYVKYTAEVIESGEDRFLLSEASAITTSAVTALEMDFAIPIYLGNHPFMVWFKYKKKGFRYYLSISMRFHNAQMDLEQAGEFFDNLQREIRELKVN